MTHNGNDIPVVSLWELADLPEGLYDAGERKMCDYFDESFNEFKRNIRCALLVRVRAEGLEKPTGVDRFYVREDGKQIIWSWVPCPL